MNILSLFDGMSCGRIALDRAGVQVDNYYASEVDKYAIQIAKKNYPETHQLGDVRKICVTNAKKYNIDLLMGGSPCQGFSFIGKNLNFADPRSKLFFDFYRFLTGLKPRWFLLENVLMNKKSQNVISSYLGVEPVMLDSSLVSAQSRKRLYWTNIPIGHLDDKQISISDVVGEKAVGCARRARYINGKYGRTHQQLEFRTDDKANAMTTVRKNCMVFLPNQGEARYVNVKEAEELQTVPNGYTGGVSDTQRFRMLGNGWTVDVISHILKGIQ